MPLYVIKNISTIQYLFHNALVYCLRHANSFYTGCVVVPDMNVLASDMTRCVCEWCTWFYLNGCSSCSPLYVICVFDPDLPKDLNWFADVSWLYYIVICLCDWYSLPHNIQSHSSAAVQSMSRMDTRPCHMIKPDHKFFVNVSLSDWYLLCWFFINYLNFVCFLYCFCFPHPWYFSYVCLSDTILDFFINQFYVWNIWVNQWQPNNQPTNPMSIDF